MIQEQSSSGGGRPLDVSVQMLVIDVRQLVLKLIALADAAASAIEARSDATPKSGAARQGESAAPKEDAR